MTNIFGGNSVYTKLKKVIVRKPTVAFSEADPVLWNYTSKPNLDNAIKEHDQIVGTLKQYNVEVIYHDIELMDKADSIYVFDPIYMSDYGAIILRPGKDLRLGEETAMKNKITELGIPILVELTQPAIAEGGDILWVDDKTLAIGVGFRTNMEAVRQLREVLEPKEIAVLSYDLSYFHGPKSCLHLLTFISIVDEKLAVIYPKLMPVTFYQMLVEKGFDFVEVTEEEFNTMGPNVLAIEPKVCLMIDGNPKTKEGLEKKGCKVHTYSGVDISLKSEGGPTCLTRPILRG